MYLRIVFLSTHASETLPLMRQKTSPPNIEIVDMNVVFHNSSHTKFHCMHKIN